MCQAGETNIAIKVITAILLPVSTIQIILLAAHKIRFCYNICYYFNFIANSSCGRQEMGYASFTQCHPLLPIHNTWHHTRPTYRSEYRLTSYNVSLSIH